MHWSDIVMMVGIIIISTYIFTRVLGDIKYTISKISIIRTRTLDDLRYNDAAWKRYLEGK
jgi:hypothetical protein